MDIESHAANLEDIARQMDAAGGQGVTPPHEKRGRKELEGACQRR
jgi:hypothetical protein